MGAFTIMYAVVKTGGKQYRVSPGAVIKVERLAAEVGATIALDQVLMIGDHGSDGPRVGTPLIDGAKVAAEVLEQSRAPKVIVFKKKRRKNYRRKRGHRQLQTVLRIQDIALA
jgi:large subunit ribosomal protein L21